MPLVVEDGTGLSNSNSYADLAFVNQYLTDRGRTLSWTNAQIEASLIKATDYIEARFGAWFIGQKLTDTQALSFPREYFPNDPDYGLVPINLKKALVEYATRAFSIELLSDDVSIDLKSKSEKVGPIEEKTEYYESRNITLQTSFLVENLPIYPAADLLLEPLLRKPVSRAIR